VMDAARSRQAVIVAADAAAFIAILFAAAHPDRTSGLVLVNATARIRRAPDYPFGMPDRLVDAFFEAIEGDWGSAPLMEFMDPSLAGDEESRAAWARYERATVSPGTMVAMSKMLIDTDVRGVLSSVRVPTLVIHRVEDPYLRIGHGRYLAEHIPSARLLELPGRDHSPDVGDAAAIRNAIEEFVTGAPPTLDADRILATVLFIDIVRSTERAEQLGDRRWTEMLERYLDVVDRQLVRYGGRRIKATGDGVVATFDGPARGVRCATALRDALRSVQLTVRAGVHTGEVEVVGDDIAGIGVHIAARVSSLAGDGEVFVSRTVKDLVAGSGIVFADRGTHALKGVQEPWQLYCASSG
jgi:class 3 adenylate cyclase